MALALDGSGTNNSGGASTLSASLTTSNGSGVIVCYVLNTGSIVPNTPTATGLTFTQRITKTSAGGEQASTFTAPYTSNFSGNITVTLSSSTFITIIVFGISGAATSSFFDTNVSLPAFQTNGGNVNSASFSTSNANDFIFWCGCPTNGGSGDTYSMSDSSTVTVIDSVNFASVVYTIAAATKSSVNFTNGTESMRIDIVDAIVAGGAGYTPYDPWPQWAPVLGT